MDECLYTHFCLVSVCEEKKGGGLLYIHEHACTRDAHIWCEQNYMLALKFSHVASVSVGQISSFCFEGVSGI